MGKAIIREWAKDQTPVQSEDEHFMICPVYRKKFDMRDLAQIMKHIHEGAEYPSIGVH